MIQCLIVSIAGSSIDIAVQTQALSQLKLYNELHVLFNIPFVNSIFFMAGLHNNYINYVCFVSVVLF